MHIRCGSDNLHHNFLRQGWIFDKNVILLPFCNQITVLLQNRERSLQMEKKSRIVTLGRIPPGAAPGADTATACHSMCAGQGQRKETFKKFLKEENPHEKPEEGSEPGALRGYAAVCHGHGTGAAFTDEDDFSPQYAEAAEVLAGMKVMQGYDDGSFLPQRNITRAQVATLIYRAATGDVTDSQTDIYSDYDKFDDVQSTDWFAGYVNYCGNAELIKGFTPTTFGPNKNVTGYQVLAMILRAVGYDQNDEFTGSGWEIRTASTAESWVSWTMCRTLPWASPLPVSWWLS